MFSFFPVYIEMVCWYNFLVMLIKSYNLTRKTQGPWQSADNQTQVWTQTNKSSVKTALVSDRWFGYLSNISLVQESKLNALEKLAFDVEVEAGTGKWEIWFCFPFGYTTKEREYFKMLLSSVSLDSFCLLPDEHWEHKPSSLLHWAVCIMFSLISALASRMTPPHWPEWRRIYLICPYSSQ